jgi:hypothetical protein
VRFGAISGQGKGKPRGARFACGEHTSSVERARRYLEMRGRDLDKTGGRDLDWRACCLTRKPWNRYVGRKIYDGDSGRRDGLFMWKRNGRTGIYIQTCEGGVAKRS